MIYCQQCGNPMGDQDKFCNRCGGRGAAVPQYQQPVYRQPQYSSASQKPFKPPFWAIGLFNLIGAIVVFVLSSILNTILLTLGFSVGAGLLNLVLSVFFTVIYLLITCIGFTVYNSSCRRNYHPEKKLSFLWAGIPWLLRSVFSFVFGMLWGVLIPVLVYEVGISTAILSVVTIAWNIISMLLCALLTWLITGLILKAVVKNK